MRVFLYLTVSVASLAGVASADGVPPTTVETVTIQARDPAGLLESQPDATVFGLDKPLLDTGRQASFASAETLQRYGVQSINDLVAVAPGTFTDSYYGVAGAVNLRGTLAENYFRGFKRIENRGTYPTPLGAADRIEIVRGPATPAIGPGKVGGFLNFTPKSARGEHGFLDRPTGDVEIEGGSYDHQRISADFGAPLKLGTAQGGVFAYAEVDDSHSYYHGIYPSHRLGQLSADLDLGWGWTTGFGGMCYHSDGNVQTPGWNRLTQALINTGQYQAGRNTVLADSNGDGRLGHAEADAGASPGAGLITPYFGFTPATDPRFQLTSGVTSGTLSPRTVFVSPADFSRTDTTTLDWDLNKAMTDGQSLKLQLFYDDLKNKRFVSYGFPTDYNARVLEARLGWDVKRTYGEVKTETLLGAAVRVYAGDQRESFNGGYLSLDRRDLSRGPTATDIFADPFHDRTIPWETRVTSRWRDSGLFAVTDLTWRSLDLTLGGRYDDFHVVSRDNGTLVYGAVAGRTYQRDKGDVSYSATLTWHGPLGVMPYVTTARTASLELGQAGGVAPPLLAGTSWLTASTLSEAGVKLRALGDSLTGSLGAYRQTRTRLEQGNAVVGTKGEGVELELRWLATRNLSFTFAGNLQRTTVLGPDTGFIVIPPASVGITGVNGYGGAYAVYSVAQLRPGNSDQRLTPLAVASLYGVYTADRMSWGRAGATLGATSVSRTASILPGGFVLPAYVTVNASAFVEQGAWRVSANIDNLADARFFTPVADVYADVAALPGIGRTWRLAMRRSY